MTRAQPFAREFIEPSRDHLIKFISFIVSYFTTDKQQQQLTMDNRQQTTTTGINLQTICASVAPNISIRRLNNQTKTIGR